MKLHVSDSSSVHHQEFFTLHTAVLYVIQLCWQLTSRIRMELIRPSLLILLASCQQICMSYTIAVCAVKNSWWWTEELSETCRVSFQNKFEKLVHLLGFIIRKRADSDLITCCEINWPLYVWRAYWYPPIKDLTVPYTINTFLSEMDFCIKDFNSPQFEIVEVN
jgi:hypothetical protein